MKKKGFLKTTYHPLGEKVLPPSCLFSDRSFQTLFATETRDGTFSGADESQPSGWVIPLRRVGNPTPRRRSCAGGASSGGLR